MTRQWLKVILLVVLLVCVLKGLITFLEISNANSFHKLQTRIFRLQSRYVTSESFDGHLKRLEELFEENVKEFYHVYSNYYKPKLANAFKARRLNKEIFNVEPHCLSKPFLLIQVHSAPLNIKKRLAIRYSWGIERNTFNSFHRVNRVYQTIFVIGRSKIPSVNRVLMEEARRYNDILLTNFTDSYRALSMKTMCALSWSLDRCLPTFMMKTDDDCYVNVRNIMQFLSTQNTGKLYTGRIQWFMPANRENASKFYISHTDYNNFLLPPYASGGGYLFSGDLIPSLVNASKFRRIIPNEDANIGLLMNTLKIIPVENTNILPYIYCNESIWIRPTCDFLHPYVIHGVQNYAQLWLHYNIKVLIRIKGICEQSLKYRRQLDPPLYCPTDNSN